MKIASKKEGVSVEENQESSVHEHTCVDCGVVVGQGDDCESDYGHAYERCDACAHLSDEIEDEDTPLVPGGVI